MDPRRALRAARGHPLLYGAIAVALALRVTFWIVTDRVWEDALITLAPAHNAVRGLGLTHHPGEGHVYSFTSALSVLVPLVGEAVRQGTGLIALRVASLVAAVLACVYGYLIARRAGLGSWPTGFLLAYLAIDWNQVYFGMAGMETQMAVAIILALAYHLMAATKWATGALLGLALLARPDFILIVVPAVIYLGFQGVRGAVREVGVGALVLAPWLAFTYLYYGSVVPNTIGAKAARYVAIPPLHGLNLGPQLTWLAQTAPQNIQSTLEQFMPFYEEGSVVGAPVPYRLAAISAVLLVLLAVIGARRKLRSGAWVVVLAYVVLFLGYRVLFLPPKYYTWYIPPFTAMVALLVAAGLDALRRRFPLLQPAFVAVLVLPLAAAFVPLTVLTARVQHQVEERVRMQAGLYLRSHVAPGEAVVSESAGYIGYYSGAKLYDYPGLTSPTAVRALASVPQQQRSLIYLVADLRAPWVVLRPFELDDLLRQYPGVYREYHVEATFQANVDLESAGVQFTSIDEDFLVLRRGD